MHCWDYVDSEYVSFGVGRKGAKFIGSGNKHIHILTLSFMYSYFFFHGKLVLRVAVSTSDRQASWLAAFLQAEDRPAFKGLKSDSTTCSNVCLGGPIGRLQSGGGFQIATETAQ